VNVTLANVDYLVLLVYVLLLLAFGFYLGRKRQGADIFLGGRSLKWWQIGFSLFSANAGPMMLIGFASIGFSQGVVGSNFEWLAWIFLLLLAMFFLPHYMATKVTTMPQFLLLRFGKRSYNFLIIYSLISILVVWLGSAMYAGGLIISQIFNWSLMKAVIIIAVGSCKLYFFRRFESRSAYRYFSIAYYYFLLCHPHLPGIEKDWWCSGFRTFRAI
jgi:SSS family solute:Na+ symporter